VLNQAIPSATRPGRSDRCAAGRRWEADGEIAGWVSRWAANHSVPLTQKIAAAQIPAAGCTLVASTVTAAGPTM
jgi:hypothetical protein